MKEVVSIVDSSGVIIGAGFYIHPDFILTCRHVVEGKRNIGVMVYESELKRTLYTSKVLYRYKRLDFALLSSPESRDALELGSSRNLDPDKEYNIYCHNFPNKTFRQRLIENPGGFPDRLETVSIITTGHLEGFIEKRLRPGTSGSPLLDENNKVIGLHWGGYKQYAMSVSISDINQKLITLKRYLE